MRILNLIINKFTNDKVLKAAYLEKPLNEKYEDIHLHLIFKQEINKKDIFAIIKGLLDDATYITYYVSIESEDGLPLDYQYVDENRNKPDLIRSPGTSFKYSLESDGIVLSSDNRK